MKYIEVKISASPAGLEALAALLGGYGIQALAIDDLRDARELLSQKDSRGWDYFDEGLQEAASAPADSPQELSLAFYLEEKPENDALLQAIKLDVMKLKGRELEGAFGGPAEGLSLGRLYVEPRLRSDGEWKDTWKQYFKPFRLTERLTVRPGWEEPAPEAADGGLVIRLDPGMAFGTGRHESTALCARLLEEALRPGAAVLDVGCGSGILSIAAVLLGAGAVLAVDSDDAALEAAAENIRANGCEGRARVLRGDLLEGLSFQADVVAANLTADLILRLADGLGTCLKEGGLFIASGILTEKREAVEAALREKGFAPEKVLEDGDWCAILAARIAGGARP
jgi:ribosomal protein L11 methyltransferase